MPRRSRSIRVFVPGHLADTSWWMWIGGTSGAVDQVGRHGLTLGDRLIVASGDLRDELGALLDSNGRSLEELAGESDRPSDLLTAGARLVADGVLDICPPSGFGSDAGRSE